MAMQRPRAYLSLKALRNLISVKNRLITKAGIAVFRWRYDTK
jgi:hypothetical protein